MPPGVGRARAVVETMGKLLPFRQPGKGAEKVEERRTEPPRQTGGRAPVTSATPSQINMAYDGFVGFRRLAQLAAWLNHTFPPGPGKSDYVFHPATAEPVKGTPWLRPVEDPVKTAAEAIKSGDDAW